MNFITYKCGSKQEPNLSNTTKFDQNYSNDSKNFVTLKVRSKHELLFNKLASKVGLLSF